MSLSRPIYEPIPHEFSTEAITDEEHAKFQAVFGRLRVMDGQFIMTRVAVNGVPCTAIAYVPGVTPEEMAEAQHQPMQRVVVLEFIMTNAQLMKQVKNFAGIGNEAVTDEQKKEILDTIENEKKKHMN